MSSFTADSGTTKNGSSGYVQSNSVTAQFNTLSVDRENFRNAKEVALRDYGHVQQDLQQLKKEQAGLLTKIRTEQEGLGTLTRKRDMFCNEEIRLTRVMEQERKALELCVKRNRTLGEEADKATRQYVSDMEKASDAAASSMQSEIQSGIVALLSVEAVQSVVVPQLPNDPRIQQDFYEAFEQMRNSEEILEKEEARHGILRAKFDVNAQVLGCNNDNMYDLGLAEMHDGQQQMDLFYGPNEAPDQKMTEADNI